MDGLKDQVDGKRTHACRDMGGWTFASRGLMLHGLQVTSSYRSAWGTTQTTSMGCVSLSQHTIFSGVKCTVAP